MDTLENHLNNQELVSNNDTTVSQQPRRMWCHMCKFEFQTMNQTSFECEKCKKDFCEEIEPSIEQTDDPRQFVPYGEEQVQTSNTQQQQPTNQRNPINIQAPNFQNLVQNPTMNQASIHANFNRQGQQPRISISIQSQQAVTNPMMGINSLISQLFPITAQRTGMNNMSDNSFNNILDFLMRNDPNVHGNPPAAETSINNLPTVVFSKEQVKEESLCECTVCKDEFTEGEQLVKMPCNHMFHNPCLITWLKMHNSCPTCRFELPTDNQDYERRKQQRQERNNQNQNNRRN